MCCSFCLQECTWGGSCTLELGLACFIIDLYKSDIPHFEYPHPAQVDAPIVHVEHASMQRDVIAANNGLDRDVWLATPAQRSLESSSEVLISETPFGETPLAIPKTAWEETSQAIKRILTGQRPWMV